MKRRRFARFARPSRDRPASANSQSPGKMAPRAEKCGKSRKIPENPGKNKKIASTQPPDKKNPRSGLGRLSPNITNYEQI